MKRPLYKINNNTVLSLKVSGPWWCLMFLMSCLILESRLCHNYTNISINCIKVSLVILCIRTVQHQLCHICVNPHISQSMSAVYGCTICTYEYVHVPVSTSSWSYWRISPVSEFIGTVQRDILIGLGLNMNRFYFYNFSKAPTILDQRTFSSRGSGEILLEKLNFLENVYK
jgi:hypothetical protein